MSQEPADLRDIQRHTGHIVNEVGVAEELRVARPRRIEQKSRPGS